MTSKCGNIKNVVHWTQPIKSPMFLAHFDFFGECFMTKSEILLVVKSFSVTWFHIKWPPYWCTSLACKHMTRSCVYDKKKMVLCTICSGGTRSGRDKGINMARIPSIIHYYSTRRSTETFHDRVCSKHFISGKAVKLWDRYDLDLVPTQNLGH